MVQHKNGHEHNNGDVLTGTTICLNNGNAHAKL